MKKRFRLLSCLLAVALLTAPLASACQFGSSSSSDGGTGAWDMHTVYAKAQALGYEGSLEEFIQSVTGKDGEKGEKGDTGVSISNVYVNADGELIVELTDNTKKNCGKVNGNKTCEHSYQLKDFFDETCESIGYQTYECETCKEVKYTFLKALGHDWQPVGLDGTEITGYQCKRCELVKLDAMTPIYNKTYLVVQANERMPYYAELGEIAEAFEELYAETSFVEGEKGVEIVFDNSSTTTFNAGTDVFLAPANALLPLAQCADLTDVLTESGTRGSILDRLSAQEKRDCYALNEKYYAVPYIRYNWGILYNATLFENKGFSVPNTTDELLALSARMKIEGISPLLSAGTFPQCWDGLLQAWWAQYDGVDGFEKFYLGIDENGNVSDKIFDRAGLGKSLGVLKNILSAEYLDTASFSLVGTSTSAQMQFLTSFYQENKSTVAMLVDSLAADAEMELVYQEIEQVYTSCPTVRMMKTPVLSAIIEKCPSIESDEELSAVVAAVDNGETELDGVSAADFAIVKAARNIVAANGYNIAVHKDTQGGELAAAKAFIKYVTSDAALTETAIRTGAVAPYGPNVSMAAGTEMSALQADCCAIMQSGSFLPNLYTFELYQRGLKPLQGALNALRSGTVVDYLEMVKNSCASLWNN